MYTFKTVTVLLTGCPPLFCFISIRLLLLFPLASLLELSSRFLRNLNEVLKKGKKTAFIHL